MADQRPFVGIGDENFICVTLKLFDALQQISKFRGPVDLIWVDQICIDQCNFSERAYQVSIMRDIFQDSSDTYIWLGPEDESTDRAYELITKIKDAKVDPIDALIVRHRNDLYDLNDINGSSLVILLANETDESWEALSNLIVRPWFFRLWTFQEVVVSALKQTVICDNQFCKWIELAVAAWICSLWKPQTINAEHVLNTVLTQSTHFNKNTHLLDVLRRTGKEYECSDPRDRVFAMIGLIPAGGPDIEIDYTKDLRSVFMSVALAFMKNSNSLEYFSSVNERIDPFSIHLASWCPDWRAPPSAPLPRRNKYHASRDRIHVYPHEADSNILQVYGRSLDVVEDVEELEPIRDLLINVSNETSLDALKDVLCNIEQKILTRCPQVSLVPGSGSLKDLIIRTLTVDGTQNIPNSAAEISEMTAAVFDHTEERSRTEDSGDDVISGLPRLRREAVFCKGRRLLILQKQTIGLGPLATQKGDIISILHGSPTPVVLRSEGDSYRVVGQCFVHGMMYGEAVTWAESEGDLILLV